MTLWWVLALVAVFPSISIADETPSSQLLVTTVENLGSIPASQAASGLGFNINPANEWEFRMAAEAGAVEGRVQFSWEAVESFDGDLALVTRTDVPLYRSGDGQVTYEVADNPVALLVSVGCH
jgi:hypothetical protein